MNTIKLLFFVGVFFFAPFTCLIAQRNIKMERVNNTYQIPCKVNGIPMNFVFDTGASDVMISATEAMFMIKQGLLTKDDFLDEVQYQIASGEKMVGTRINLKTIEIDGITLRNIRASVIDSQSAPILLGQSAISKLGRYSINGDELTLLDYSPKQETSTYSNPEYKSNRPVKTMNTEALSYVNNYLTSTTWAGEEKGHLTYDPYSNTLQYIHFIEEKNSMTNEEIGKIRTEFSIPLDNIIGIIEMIHEKDPNKEDDLNAIMFTIHLNVKVFEKHISTGVNSIPEQNSRLTNRLHIQVPWSRSRYMLKSQIDGLRQAIRDVFDGVAFETKNWEFPD
jgi:clan AA aspartic protease (TIGR02281 family)